MSDIEKTQALLKEGLDCSAMLEGMWKKAQTEGDKLHFSFSKKDTKVSGFVRNVICEMTQLNGISRMEIRPVKDKYCVSFNVNQDRNKARELVGTLCTLAEAWRCHNDIMISLVPKRIYYKSSIRER